MTVFNVSMVAGETRVLAVTFTDAAGVPIGLTGAKLTYRLYLPTVVEKTEASGITVTDEAAGTYEVALDEADTLGVNWHAFVAHECRALLSTGDVVNSFTGLVEIEPTGVGSMGTV